MLDIVSAARSPARGKSGEAARLFADLMAVSPEIRRGFLKGLSPADLRQVLAVASREGGTPFAIWRDDPVGFVYDVLRESMWSRPREIMQSIVVNRRTAVPSCFSSGKCVYRKEMLMLADGSLVKAEDLIGKQFDLLGWSEDGTQTVRRAHASWNAVEPVYRVTTGDGREIIRNGHHPLYAADLNRYIRSGGKAGTVIATPEGIGWREIHNLQPGNLVLVPEAVHPQLTERMPFHHAALLGYLLGDGHTMREVRFSHLPGETLDEFIACVDACGSQVKDYPVQEGRRHRELVVRGTGERGVGTARRYLINPVWDLVKDWGLAGKRATEKRFPDFVWRLHLDDLAVILSRLFACDGWATFGKHTKSPKTSSVGISLANEALIKDVQRAMLRFGINGRIYHKKVKSGGKVFPYWEWVVGSAVDLRRFADTFTVPGKQGAIEDAAALAAERRHTLLWPHRNAPEGYRWEKVKSIERLPDQGTVAIEVDVDHTWVDLFVEHNTWSAARLALWWSYTHPVGSSLVVTMAPQWRQVVRLLWPEIRRAHSRAGLPGTADMAQLKLPDHRDRDVVASYGLAAPPWNEVAVQGIHSESLLLLMDEAGGISHVIGNNVRGMLVGENARLLAIGNPPTDEEGSWFEELCGSDGVNVLPISAYSTPAFTGEAEPQCRGCMDGHPVSKHLVDPPWVTEAIAENGEDSNYVIAKVHARFPRGGPSRALPSLWVDNAAESEEPLDEVEAVRLCDLGLADETAPYLVRPGDWIRLGVDVAADGGDEFVIARAVGDLITIEHISVGADNENSIHVAGVVLEHIRRAEALRKALGTPQKVRVKIDGIGVGWGLGSPLRAWAAEGVHDAEIVMVVVSESTDREIPESATLRPWRKRDEMWLAMRSLLQPSPGYEDGRVRLRVDRKALGQLRAPKRMTSSSGYTVIESKKSLKDRGISSPDRGEAILLSIYEPLIKPKRRQSRVLA